MLVVIVLSHGTADPVPELPTLEELRQEIHKQLQHEAKAIEQQDPEQEETKTQFIRFREEWHNGGVHPMNPQQICGRYPSGYV